MMNICGNMLAWPWYHAGPATSGSGDSSRLCGQRSFSAAGMTA